MKTSAFSLITATLLLSFVPNVFEAAWPTPPPWQYPATWNARYHWPEDVAGQTRPSGARYLTDKDYAFIWELGVYYQRHYPWVYSEAYGWLYIGERSTIHYLQVYLLDRNAVQLSFPRRIGPEGWYALGWIQLVVSEYAGMDRGFWTQRVYSYGEEKWMDVILGIVSMHKILYIENFMESVEQQ